MNSEDLTNLIDSINGKLGDESSALISDDLGNLITKNTEIVNSLSSKDKEIKRLNDLNQKLISANGSLLQQVGAGIEKSSHTSEEEPPKKSFDFRDAFDEKGRFKRKL